MTTLDGSNESSQQSILRHIRNQETANGHLADELNRTIEKQKNTLSGSVWGHLKDNFGMPNQNGRTMIEDIIDFVKSLKEEVRRLQCDNVALNAKHNQNDLFPTWQLLKTRFNMPSPNCTYENDIIAFVEALKKGFDESQREVTRMQGVNLDLVRENNDLRSAAQKFNAQAISGRNYINAIKDIITKAQV